MNRRRINCWFLSLVGSTDVKQVQPLITRNTLLGKSICLHNQQISALVGKGEGTFPAFQNRFSLQRYSNSKRRVNSFNALGRKRLEPCCGPQYKFMVDTTILTFPKDAEIGGYGTFYRLMFLLNLTFFRLSFLSGLCGKKALEMNSNNFTPLNLIDSKFQNIVYN